MSNISVKSDSGGDSGGGDAPIRNVMSVDVEDYFHVSALAESITRDDWDSLEVRADESTRRLLRLFDEEGAKATFFILGWMARKCPGLIREIHSGGHEVACHGMSHELVYRQSPEVFRQETRESKELLEDIIGDSVVGYRAASWSITNASLWALDIIADLGFEYDSSIFPIRHDRYGIPGASRRPERITTPEGASLVEFPPSTIDIAGIRLPVAGGGYFRLLPYGVTKYGLNQVNKRLQLPFMFYLHPWEVDPEQPRVPARFVSRFRHYTNLDKTEGRLRRLLQRFKCATARDVLVDLQLLAA